MLLPPAPQPLPTGRTVAQVIVERFELSIFEQALQGSGLLNAIKQATPTNPLTVFAPTNAAFLKYVATRYVLGLSQIPPTVCPYKTDTFFYLSQTV